MKLLLSHRTSRRLVFFVSFCGIVAGAIIAAESSPWVGGTIVSDDTASTERALRVRVAPAGSIVSPPTYSRFRGTVRSRRESMLAFRRGGRVFKIDIHEGDEVAAGEVLAVLDTVDLVAEQKRVTSQLAMARAELAEALAGPRQQVVDVAAAEVRRARADLALARTDMNREQSLLSRNAGSRRTYDAASFAVDQREASFAAAEAKHAELVEGTRVEQVEAKKAAVAVAEAAVARNEVDFEHSKIVAPYDGVIAARHLDEGAVVSPNSVALRLIEAPPLEARFGLPQHIAASMRKGDRVQLERALPGDLNVLNATVIRVHPTLSLQTRTRDVDVLLAADAPVVAGETLTLRRADESLLDADNEAFWIPTEALVRGSRGLWSLMVAAGSDSATVAQRRDVEVIRTTGPFTQIRGMIRKGELIIVEGINRIGPGVRVTVASAPVAGESPDGVDGVDGGGV